MAKRKGKHPGLRDASVIPADPYIQLSDGFLKREWLLECDAPIGAYKVDAVVIEMQKAGEILNASTHEEIVRAARAIADASAGSAIEQARNELTAPIRRQHAKTLFQSLDNIRQSIRAAKKTKGSEIACFIARDDDVDCPDDDVKRMKQSHQFAEAIVDELIDDLNSLDTKINHFLARYSISKSIGSSAEPLTNWFIFGCAQGWRSLTGSWVKSTETISFRRFLEAAWIDLKFPEPMDRYGKPKPLEDHFRDRLAKSDIFNHFRGN